MEELQYRLTDADLKAYLQANKSGGHIQRMGMQMSVLVFLFVVIFAWSRGNLSGLSLGVISAALLALYLAYRRSADTSMVVRSHPLEESMISVLEGPICLRVVDEHIIYGYGGREEQYESSAIEKVCETNDYTFVYTDKLPIILPHDRISEADLHQFISDVDWD